MDIKRRILFLLSLPLPKGIDGGVGVAIDRGSNHNMDLECTQGMNSRIATVESYESNGDADKKSHPFALARVHTNTQEGGREGVKPPQLVRHTKDGDLPASGCGWAWSADERQVLHPVVVARVLHRLYVTHLMHFHKCDEKLS